MSGTGVHGHHRTEPIDEPADRSGKKISVGVIIVIACTVVIAVGLLLGLIVCCIRRWKKRRAHPPLPPRGRASSSGTGDRVQGEVALTSARVQGEVALTSAHEREGSQLSPEHPIAGEICGICRRCYDDAPPRMLHCGHGFHPRCICRWLQVNLACPVCNTTHIVLCGDTPGDASAPRHRYSLSMGSPSLSLTLDD